MLGLSIFPFWRNCIKTLNDSVEEELCNVLHVKEMCYGYWSFDMQRGLMSITNSEWALVLVEEVSIMVWNRGRMQWKKTKAKVKVRDVYELGGVRGQLCDLDGNTSINSGQRYEAARQGWPAEDTMAGGGGWCCGGWLCDVLFFFFFFFEICFIVLVLWVLLWFNKLLITVKQFWLNSIIPNHLPKSVLHGEAKKMCFTIPNTLRIMYLVIDSTEQFFFHLSWKHLRIYREYKVSVQISE